MSLLPISLHLLTCVLFPPPVAGTMHREWKDSTGHYRLSAQLIAYNNKSVVLQKENKELISIDIKDLSTNDQRFLRTTKVNEQLFASANGLKTWTLQSGLKVKGRVVEFAKRNVTFQLQNGRIYINDKLFKNLPPIYQKMAPRMVSHFEKIKIDDEAGLTKWLTKAPGQQKKFPCEGILFELENGDRYGVPMFFISAADQIALKPSWQRWLAAGGNSNQQQSNQQQQQESFYLRAQTQANTENIAQIKQIAQVKLQLQAYDAGLFDLWEVGLYPPAGSNSRPMSVVVPGRNSDQAANAALRMYPGARVGPVAKVRRK
jgi:hypothetical protein